MLFINAAFLEIVEVVNSTVSVLTDPQIVVTDNVDCFGGSTGRNTDHKSRY